MACTMLSFSGGKVLFHMAGMHTKLCLFLMIGLKTSYDIENIFDHKG
jgi:hypothetical protein